MSVREELSDLREHEYARRLEVSLLRREVWEQADPAGSDELLARLHEAEGELSDLEQRRAQVQAVDPTASGVVVDTAAGTGVLGAETTGLEAKVQLRMAQVPTSICHLLRREQNPLVSCTVRNTEEGGETRRLRIISFVDGYSAQAVETVELEPLDEYTFTQLPTFYPERLRGVTELTTASLNVMLEDIDGRLELHRTEPVWLLARTTAPLAVLDPASGQWKDLTRYFGAFVTPNAPEVMSFVRKAADHHPDKRLIGYQGPPDGRDERVASQVQAVFEALKAKAEITYVNSVVSFSPEEGAASQRVRLPRESLADHQANCIDGTVLVASLLESISMSPAIVVVPGHAFVAWETWRRSDEWRYLETTMIGSHDFEQACESAERTAEHYRTLAERTGDPSRFRLWPLRVLRATDRITPME